MLSTYIWLGIICSLYFWLSRLSRSSGFTNRIVKVLTCLFFYIITRPISILMIKGPSVNIWINLTADLILFSIFLLVIRHAKYSDFLSIIYSIYIFNPFFILCILSGTLPCMLFIPALIFILFIISSIVKASSLNNVIDMYYFEYVIFLYSCSCIYISVKEFNQSLSQINNVNNIPMFLIISLDVLLCVSGWFIFRLLLKDPDSQTLSDSRIHNQQEEDSNHEQQCPEPWTARETLTVLILTIFFAFIVFYRIGTVKSPQTSLILSKSEENNGQIILNFGETKNISKISIFLGYESARTMAFSVPDGNNGWTVFDGNHKVESAFCWNDVNVNWSTYSIGIVLLDDEAYIQELVIIDGDGNQIIPTNANQYYNLFDEQSSYPEYPTYYYRSMFDEVYHARTAYEFLNGYPIYENTHPPLGKTIISLGIALFGMNPFGWRFMCAVFGILMVPLFYIFARRITGKRKYALFSALLICTGFMHYTLSRIATIDIIVAFFILLMFYFMYCFTANCRKGASLARQSFILLLCGISTGLAIATKWTGIYAAIGIAVLFFYAWIPSLQMIHSRSKRLRNIFSVLGVCIISFILIPASIYILSYIPFSKIYTGKSLIQLAMENSISMLSYHSSVSESHPYMSSWYEWLIDRRPLLDSYTDVSGNKKSLVSTLGNPFIYWGGLIALLHNIYLWKCKRDNNSFFLSTAWVSMLFPWLFVHRTVFIYQYFVSSLFLILIITYSISRVYDKKRKNNMYFGALIVSFILFILFFPAISGVSAGKLYFQQVLEWFPTWPF